MSIRVLDKKGRPVESVEIAIWVFPKSKNRDTPKSSILIGFSIINHPFWGTIIFGNTHIVRKKKSWIFQKFWPHKLEIWINFFPKLNFFPVLSFLSSKAGVFFLGSVSLLSSPEKKRQNYWNTCFPKKRHKSCRTPWNLPSFWPQVKPKLVLNKNILLAATKTSGFPTATAWDDVVWSLARAKSTTQWTWEWWKGAKSGATTKTNHGKCSVLAKYGRYMGDWCQLVG